MSTHESYYVGIERDEEAKKIAEGIMATDVKGMDALHVACAILSGKAYLCLNPIARGNKNNEENDAYKI